MDELVKQGHWWWLLVVPVLTGAFALLGSWWGSRLGRMTEHKQWLRNEKVEVYALFVRQLNLVTKALRLRRDGETETGKPLSVIEDTTNARLLVIAPPHVRDAIIEHRKFFTAAGRSIGRPSESEKFKELDANYWEVLKVMRKDLDLKHWH